MRHFEFFTLFFDDEVISFIIEETNIYAYDKLKDPIQVIIQE